MGAYTVKSQFDSEVRRLRAQSLQTGGGRHAGRKLLLRYAFMVQLCNEVLKPFVMVVIQKMHNIPREWNFGSNVVIDTYDMILRNAIHSV